jgi:AhpD family alkylhydroperoxidase
MATIEFVEYEDASPEVKEVYDDIMATRNVDWINNFWKALAVQPELLRRTWNGVKEVMAPGTVDALTKEMIYVAVSTTNGCKYCINSHTAAARKKGMTEKMLSELMAVVGMANQTNALANGFQIEVDHAFQNGGRSSQQHTT